MPHFCLCDSGYEEVGGFAALNRNDTQYMYVSLLPGLLLSASFGYVPGSRVAGFHVNSVFDCPYLLQ